MELSISLRCIAHDNTRVASLTVPLDALLVNDIKKHIQDKFDIPVCAQTVTHSSVVLRDDTPISAARLRSGDELQVSYYATANCKELQVIIEWIESVVASLKVAGIPTSKTLSPLKHTVLFDQGTHLTTLSFEYFSNWGSPENRMNKLYFVQNGGLDHLSELYSMLIDEEWLEMPRQLKKLESEILSALWNLSETFQNCHEVLRRGVLAMCLKSLLRTTVMKNMAIQDWSNCSFEERDYHAYFLKKTLHRSVGLLAK